MGIFSESFDRFSDALCQQRGSKDTGAEKQYYKKDSFPEKYFVQLFAVRHSYSANNQTIIRGNHNAITWIFCIDNCRGPGGHIDRACACNCSHARILTVWVAFNCLIKNRTFTIFDAKRKSLILVIKRISQFGNLDRPLIAVYTHF